MGSQRWVWVVVAVAAGVVTVAGDQRSLPTQTIGPPRNAPSVVVALGDSTIAGEGAGDYEPGTDGDDGNWCHRSTKASVHQVRAVGIDGTINLACSGAPTAQVGLGKAKQYTEPSQAARLVKVAKENRVVAVVVAAGANDEPAFSHVLDECVNAWLDRGRPGCAAGAGKGWQARVDAMVPKLVRALDDVREAMASAGYQPFHYQLIVQSYAAPVGPDVADGLQDLSGCPLRSEDLRWVRDSAVPTITAGIRKAARDANARFLDLSRAGVGREACSSRNDAGREWFRRLAIQWNDLHSDERATHALQESFHPNAKGYEQFGRCLGEFINTPDRAGACLPGTDGNLHAAASVGSD